ncbi:SDR family NAD(P)-dependent oxidoreductase [Streptomyces boluensis]|uniref:SDR family oxidoreductase n=1 Tax=Streptomyces boluensis TaxID=1775135 RepID=A0A964UUW1_9ACTN|nr:SDR family oxidoreductase [Streptomyces boluensis]NBE55863.1 SDR family oxidoreductase [Streptomyces boluensis]
MTAMNYLEQHFGLHGRTALVTGGSSGIGRAIAAGLAGAGAHVVLLARREEPLKEAVHELNSLGLKADHLTADLGDRSALRAAADRAAEAYGEPDILVTSAGVNLRPPFDELTEDEWDTTMAVNLDAPFLLGKRFGPGMAERGWGRIIHLASQQSVRAFGNSGAYGVSKAAVAGLARSQAEAWAPYGVCVNALAPGFVHTPLTEPVFADPARAAAMAARTMAGRNGEAEDCAGAAVFLASDAARYVNGQTLFVDGGFSVT